MQALSHEYLAGQIVDQAQLLSCPWGELSQDAQAREGPAHLNAAAG